MRVRAGGDKKADERRPLVGVIGAGECGAEMRGLAREVGRLIGRAGFGLVNGGLGGVMEASAEGCRAEGGLTIGILPGLDEGDANPYIDVALPTGLGEMRNLLVVRAAGVLIAVGGALGTLSEMALGLKGGKAVISLCSWEFSDELIRAATPKEAVDMALRALCGKPAKR